MAIELLVNGERKRVEGDAARSLLSVLRDDLDLTGAKYGCGEGRCGACTVLIDGKPQRSCVTPVGDCADRPITTIESLERDGQLHPLQAAFIECGALQCGYCTTGMIMASLPLIEKNQSPSESDITRALQGNLCRCGTYPRIIKAVQQAAKGGAR